MEEDLKDFLKEKLSENADNKSYIIAYLITLSIISYPFIILFILVLTILCILNFLLWIVVALPAVGIIKLVNWRNNNE